MLTMLAMLLHRSGTIPRILLSASDLSGRECFNRLYEGGFVTVGRGRGTQEPHSVLRFVSSL